MAKDPDTEKNDPLLGRVIANRYELTRCVGKGGMGSVYAARHVTTEKRVALKILAPHLSKDLKLIARFRREALAASRLDHENCVSVYDFGEDEDGTFYIAMEFVDGTGLGQEIRAQGPMSQARVAHIGVQLLSALDAAHATGILHRDLKPQNIMLTQRGTRRDIVKVVDFGIAKFINNSKADQAALTVPGTIFGTPEYMSPEQARGEPLGPRSDIYSAAVVLWHLMLGRSPFRGKTVRDTLVKVFSDRPPSPRKERPSSNIAEAFEDVLRKALDKDAAGRYPDAGSFLIALQPFMDLAYVDPTPQRASVPGLAPDGSAPETLGDESPKATMIGHVGPDADVVGDGHRQVIAPGKSDTALFYEPTDAAAAGLSEDKAALSAQSPSSQTEPATAASALDGEVPYASDEAPTAAMDEADLAGLQPLTDAAEASPAAAPTDGGKAPPDTKPDDVITAELPQPEKKTTTAVLRAADIDGKALRQQAYGRSGNAARAALIGGLLGLIIIGGLAGYLFRSNIQTWLATADPDPPEPEANPEPTAAPEPEAGPEKVDLLARPGPDYQPDGIALRRNLRGVDFNYDSAHSVLANEDGLPDDEVKAEYDRYMKLALRHARLAVIADNNSADAHRRLAQISFELKDFPTMGLHYERVLELSPDLPEDARRQIERFVALGKKSAAVQE